MRLLCVDTSGDHPVVACVHDGDLVSGAVGDARAQQVLELCDAQLAAAGWRRSQLDGVAVGIGPGGFTGLRVGVVSARGIAESLDVPLYPIPSLAAYAATMAFDAPDEIVRVLLDARRGESFTQRWRWSSEFGELQPLDAASAVAASQQFDEHICEQPHPDPGSLARAATQLIATGAAAAADPLTVVPTYVRAPDAQPPRPRLRIDELCEADLDALLRLEARCYTHPWTRAMYVEELRRPASDAVLLAARDLGGGGRLVGAILVARIGDDWHIMNVLVDPPARRRGIATQLMDAMFTRTAAAPAANGWTLEVRASNLGAIGLYERYGFVNLGRRPGYYANDGEDAIIMTRGAADEVTDA